MMIAGSAVIRSGHPPRDSDRARRSPDRHHPAQQRPISVELTALLHGNGPFEFVDLAGVLSTVLIDLEVLFTETGAAMEAALLPRVWSDPTLLYQIVGRPRREGGAVIGFTLPISTQTV